MARAPKDFDVVDGEPVDAQDMLEALTAGTFIFPDGATQTFTDDGKTTYIEGGRPTYGEWSVLGDGRFSSFWPPSYRAAYAVRWIVEAGAAVGVNFTEARSGTGFVGRYQ